MDIIPQEYEIVDLMFDNDPLREHPQNPNLGDTEIIDESIGANGWYGAVVAQKSTGYILVGNHRYRVAKQKGAKTIPVIWQDVDDDTALKILLADNETGRRGGYDEAKLEEVLASLDTLEGTGFETVSRLEREGSSNGAGSPEPRESGETDGLSMGDVPDDKHEPQYAVIILCASEKQQEETYRWFKQEWPDREIKLTST